MMTGQILSGSNPSVAARYQMMIMFLTHACTAISATGAVLSVLWTVVDQDHTLHAEALVARGGGRGITGVINACTQRAVDVVLNGVHRVWRQPAGGSYQPIPACATR